MRILRYLINTSLALSLSFAGLHASKDEVVHHLLDDTSLMVVAQNTPQIPNRGALGFSVAGAKVYDQTLIQADRNPTDLREDNHELYRWQSSCEVRVTNAAKRFATSGVYSGLDAALEAASTHNCHEVVIQRYHQRIKKTRTYPAGTQFSIAPALSQRLARVDTSNVSDFKKAMDSLGEHVVTSASMGYLAMLELKICFRSSENVAAFRTALAANPSAFAFLTGAHSNSNNDAQGIIPDDAAAGNTSGVGQTQDNNNRKSEVIATYCQADSSSLINLAGHIRRASIQVEMTASLLKCGELVDETPPAGVTAHFSSTFGDIASLVHCSNAYEKWINQNLSKAISSFGVVGVSSKPIVSLLGYESPIAGLFRSNEPLSLQSAKDLLKQKLQDRDNAVCQFIEMIQSSAKTQEEKKNKRQNIMGLINTKLDCFQSLIDDKIFLDSADNQLIHYASFFDLPELITKLVRMGADINSANEQGMTPLMIVARNGYLKSFFAMSRACFGPDRKFKLELEDNLN